MVNVKLYSVVPPLSKSSPLHLAGLTLSFKAPIPQFPNTPIPEANKTHILQSSNPRDRWYQVLTHKDLWCKPC